MNYVSVENLEKNLGERILFSDLNFGLSKGDKMALVANNGTGKSSLLKIMTGKDQPSAGKVVFRNGIRFGFLEQEPDFNESVTISELIRTANSEMLEIISSYHNVLENQAENYSSQDQKALDDAMAKMDEFGAWDYERRLNEILTKFEIEDQTTTGSYTFWRPKKAIGACTCLTRRARRAHFR